MLYQLPDGRTVEISIYDYLDCTDQELNDLLGYTNVGDFINNPSYGSIITKPGSPDPDPNFFDEVDLPDIPSSHKLSDQDYEPDSE